MGLLPYAVTCFVNFWHDLKRKRHPDIILVSVQYLFVLDYYRNSCSYLPNVTTEATGHGLKDMEIVGIVIGAVVAVMVVAVLIVVKFVILPKRRQPDATEGKGE